MLMHIRKIEIFRICVERIFRLLSLFISISITCIIHKHSHCKRYYYYILLHYNIYLFLPFRPKFLHSDISKNAINLTNRQERKKKIQNSSK